MDLNQYFVAQSTAADIELCIAKLTKHFIQINKGNIKVEKTYEQLKKKEKIVSIAGKALFFVVSLSVMMIMLGIVSSL